MPKRTQPPRGLILGLDTIRFSYDKVLLRQRKVVPDSTDQTLDTIKITASVIDACIFASMARLDPVPQNLPDTTISSALEKALQEERVLQGQRFKMSMGGFEIHLNFSDALAIFLEQQGFVLSKNVKQYLSSKNALMGYVSYDQIALILKTAGIPVYYISAQKGPEYHSVWTTP